MLDAYLIEQCADPSLKPAIVEKFVAAVGASDPFAVTVRSGERLILVPKAATSDEAMATIRRYIGRATVRVGLTRYPAGIGVMDASELKPELVDPCENLRMGTKMFAKILRIVSEAYGRPTSEGVFAYIFDDAISAWKTGRFEGEAVFRAADPGGDLPPAASARSTVRHDEAPEAPAQANPGVSDEEATETSAAPTDNGERDARKAPMRIDLSGLTEDPGG